MTGVCTPCQVAERPVTKTLLLPVFASVVSNVITASFPFPRATHVSSPASKSALNNAASAAASATYASETIEKSST